MSPLVKRPEHFEFLAAITCCAGLDAQRTVDTSAEVPFTWRSKAHVCEKTLCHAQDENVHAERLSSPARRCCKNGCGPDVDPQAGDFAKLQVGSRLCGINQESWLHGPSFSGAALALQDDREEARENDVGDVSHSALMVVDLALDLARRAQDFVSQGDTPRARLLLCYATEQLESVRALLPKIGKVRECLEAVLLACAQTDPVAEIPWARLAVVCAELEDSVAGAMSDSPPKAMAPSNVAASMDVAATSALTVQHDVGNPPVSPLQVPSPQGSDGDRAAGIGFFDATGNELRIPTLTADGGALAQGTPQALPVNSASFPHPVVPGFPQSWAPPTSAGGLHESRGSRVGGCGFRLCGCLRAKRYSTPSTSLESRSSSWPSVLRRSASKATSGQAPPHQQLGMGGRLCLARDFKRGETVGVGGQGCVFAARHSASGQIVAVKEVFLDRPASGRGAALERLARELRLLEALEHPRIVRYFGHEFVIGAQGGPERVYLYLDYCSGGSLAAHLRNYGALDLPLIKKYVAQLLEGLVYLHSLSPPVVHRDLKCANLLLTHDAEVKITDFGCSKLLHGEGEHRLTEAENSMAGSVFWMAPEALRGRQKLTCAVDIWSVGCCVVEMSNGVPPWNERKFDNILQAGFVIAQTTELPHLSSAVWDTAGSFVHACLRRVPQERPSALELQKYPLLASARS
mmetsp:Transcript_22005/g.61564  ORF Transcript_22005/g.61564 Transcript_22005/m.61564 type:complete len:689 (+) Transcript_22005:101-2167(+)